MKSTSPEALLLVALFLCAAASPQDPLSTYSEEIEVRVVEIEVEVFDPEGGPVRGLARSQFQLLVNGTAKEIEYFSEVASPTPQTGLETPRPEGLAAGRPPDDGLSVLLFIDDLYSTKRDRDRTIAGLEAQLASLRAQDRIAIVAWDGRRIDLVLPWTAAGTAELTTALQSVRDRPAFGLRERSRLGWLASPRKLATSCDEARSTTDMRCATTPRSAATPMERIEAIAVREKLERVATAVEAAIRSVPPPPGRRLAALLAGGWRSEGLEPGDMLDAWEPALEAADQLRYAFYPVDVPGMFSEFSADVERDGEGIGGSGGDGFDSPPAATDQDELILHSTLDYLAEKTGGAALVNAGRTRLLAAIAERARAYYTLGFSSPKGHDGSRHEILVRVEGKSYEVRHRRTFRDLDRATEIRMALETAVVAPNPQPAPFSVRAGVPVREGKDQVRLPLSLELLDPGADVERTFELRLLAADDEGRRVEIGPVNATLRRAGSYGERRGGEIQVTLRRTGHVIAFALLDSKADELFLARLDFSP